MKKRNRGRNGGATMEEIRVDALLAAVAAGDDDRADLLARALAPADAPALAALCSDDDAELRWWAVRGLAVCGDGGCTPVLAAALEDADAGVRAAAVLALVELHTTGRAEPAESMAVLAARLSDEDGFVRQTATDGLARCGVAALPALAEVLAGEHDGARTRAAAALRKIGQLQAAPLLFRYLNDANYMVQMYCYEALEEMGLLETMLLKP